MELRKSISAKGRLRCSQNGCQPSDDGQRKQHSQRVLCQ